VLAGWEGSAHDALILTDAIERHDGFRVPPDVNPLGFLPDLLMRGVG